MNLFNFTTTPQSSSPDPHELPLKECIENYPDFKIITTHPEFNLNIAISYSGFFKYTELTNELMTLVTDYSYAISWALANGNIEAMKSLVRSGVNVTMDYNMPIRRAVQYGDIDMILYLQGEGADLNACNYVTLLDACCQGHLNVVKYILTQSLVPQAYLNIALRKASRLSRLEIVKVLVLHGAELKNVITCSELEQNDYTNEMKHYLISQGVEFHVESVFSKLCKFCNICIFGPSM